MIIKLRMKVAVITLRSWKIRHVPKYGLKNNHSMRCTTINDIEETADYIQFICNLKSSDIY